jgi:hypothetical protein
LLHTQNKYNWFCGEAARGDYGASPQLKYKGQTSIHIDKQRPTDDTGRKVLRVYLQKKPRKLDPASSSKKARQTCEDTKVTLQGREAYTTRGRRIHSKNETPQSEPDNRELRGQLEKSKKRKNPGKKALGLNLKGLPTFETLRHPI